MKKIQQQTEGQIEQPKAKPEFKSSFKAWIRVVAFIIIAVFLPEQVAQAVEYDWRVLWHKPATGSIAPAYLKDTVNINTALAIRNILKDIANKPITAIKVSSELTISLDKPLEMSNQRIDEIFEWLKGRPCGSKALYDFLTYSGVKAEEQDIAIFALTVDILNGAVKAEGNPEIIKNSIYSLSQTAEFFGIKLYPVKITDFARSAKGLAPFIAHVNGDHFILVTQVTQDKVYFSDQHKEEFMPVETLLKKFTGYALVTKTDDSLQLLGKEEALSVLGAGNWGQTYSSTSDRYKQRNEYYNNKIKKTDNYGGYVGFDTRANPAVSTNITQNTYKAPVTFTMTSYGANQKPNYSYQTIYGTTSQYHVQEQWNQQGRNYSATTTGGMNQTFVNPITARYNNGVLVEARSGSNVMTADNARFQNMHVTGNIWDAYKYTSAVIPAGAAGYAYHKAEFDTRNTNLTGRLSGLARPSATWISAPIFPINLLNPERCPDGTGLLMVMLPRITSRQAAILPSARHSLITTSLKPLW